VDHRESDNDYVELGLRKLFELERKHHTKPSQYRRASAVEKLMLRNQNEKIHSSHWQHANDATGFDNHRNTRSIRYDRNTRSSMYTNSNFDMDIDGSGSVDTTTETDDLSVELDSLVDKESINQGTSGYEHGSTHIPENNTPHSPQGTDKPVDLVIGLLQVGERLFFPLITNDQLALAILLLKRLPISLFL